MEAVPRVIIRVRDLPEPLSYEVSPGTSILIGRMPDANRLRLENREQAWALESRRILPVKVDSMRVSANHLLVTALLDGSMELLELHSRNGTSVRLQPGMPLYVEGDVTVDLASRGSGIGSIGEPRPADWTDESDFGTQVVADGGLTSRAGPVRQDRCRRC
jgi:hypothetical protein